MDEEREGCLPFVVTEDNVTIVKKLVIQDGRTTEKQFSSENGIYVGSIELILHNHLNTKKVSAW